MLSKKSNGHDVEVTRPLKHRPSVIVVKSDGRLKVIGDGNGFSPAEFLALHGGLTPSTTPALRYTEAEQTELDAANERLERANALFDQVWHEWAEWSAKLDYARYGDSNTYYATSTRTSEAEIARLEDVGRDIKPRLIEAKELQGAALRERNAVQRRIQKVARARQFPPQFHNPQRTTEQRLSDLERGK